MADCEYSVPDKTLSGDILYGDFWACRQDFIDFFWYDYYFDYDWWQDGWGYDDCCNTDKPLARAFNALCCLNYSSPDPLNEAWNDNFLYWGSRYVREQMSGYDLRADCGTPVAETFGAGCTSFREEVHWGCKQFRDDSYSDCREWSPVFSWICFFAVWVINIVCVAFGWISSWICTVGNEVVTDKRVMLYLPFFYNERKHAPGRASTFIHESRHIDGKPHLSAFPAGSALSGGDGADPSWEYDGAWKWQVCWLAWYAFDGRNTTPALRERARDEANFFLQNAFATNPGFTV